MEKHQAIENTSFLDIGSEENSSNKSNTTANTLLIRRTKRAVIFLMSSVSSVILSACWALMVIIHRNCVDSALHRVYFLPSQKNANSYPSILFFENR
jgi:hypothetical protein